MDSLGASSSVTRSNSDMSTHAHSERNRERFASEPGMRRMSHQERLKQPPPLSPRTGRHPNAPVSSVYTF